MATRLCGVCSRRKSIRGVWYLAQTAGPGHPGTPFVCESCYVRTASAALPV